MKNNENKGECMIGDRCVSYRNVPGGFYNYLAIAVYEAVPRKKDGLVTWRLIDRPDGYIFCHGKSFEKGCRSPQIAQEAAIRTARNLGYPYMANIRHGTPVFMPVEVESPWVRGPWWAVEEG